ncbi:hypothetical protein AVEN_227861-1 [Araneus ventricosus]|uniref:Uncharacterized protein n=1 Tax=Araneus ventricosus TaxID=182803 RepID=A0A4Y2L4U7_ARAVE|nr:hypothetical protein AVEN_227861-1 [Araneus ventricosus]
MWTDDEAVSQTISSLLSDEEEVDIPAEPNITAIQAKDAVHILRSFAECSENVEKEDFAAIFLIENLAEKCGNGLFHSQKHKVTGNNIDPYTNDPSSDGAIDYFRKEIRAFIGFQCATNKQKGNKYQKYI